MALNIFTLLVPSVLSISRTISFSPTEALYWLNSNSVLPLQASQEAQVVKNPSASTGGVSFIPGLGRSPGEGKGYPLQYSGLENSMDCIVHGVSKSRTQLSDFHFTERGWFKQGDIVAKLAFFLMGCNRL